MKKLSLPSFLMGFFPVCALAASGPLPVSEDFTDGNAYQPGPLAGQRGWSVEQGNALVAGDGSGQWVEIPPSVPNGQVSLYFEKPAPGEPVFLDFLVRMGAEDKALELVDANGSVTGMLRVEQSGKLLALHRAADGAEQWLDTAVQVELDADGEMSDWLRLTFRQDGTAKTWDLYAGGKLRAANLGLASDSRESGGYLSVMGGEIHPVRLRSVAVDTHNMLFEDAGGDGLPDSWQQKLADGARDADPDADGLTNLEEFIHGTAADHDDTDGDGRTDADELAAGADPLKAEDGQEPQGVLLEIQSTAFPELARAPQSLFECRRDGVFRKVPTEKAALDRLEWSSPLRREAHASRVRGILTAPATGSYTFWVSGSESAEFFLSADDTSFLRREAARCPSATTPLDFDGFGSQRSTAIRLEAGKRYYFEIQHQAAQGKDHFAVAWRPPGGARAVISGRWLSPWTGDARDADDDGLPDEWQRSTGLYSDAASAVPEADPDGDRLSNLEEYRVGSDPLAADAEGRPGLVTREIWFGMPGRYLFDAARSGEFPHNPWWTEYRSSLESPQDVGQDFLARTRGWLVIPATGTYTFYLAADDQAELWLAEDASPFSKRRTASVPLDTGWQEWGRFPSQTSAPLQLAKGQKLYIETLHKQGYDKSHLSVAWTGPGMETPEVIGGENLVSWTETAEDADDDGLPDAWQAQRDLKASGDQPAPGEAKKLSAWGDADGDGVLNGAERLAGTDPNDDASHPDTGLQWQFWTGLPGRDIGGLEYIPSFPAAPSRAAVLTNFDYADQGDNYLARARGFLAPPVTGDYIFFLAGSDNCQLWLSPSESPFEKTLAAEVALATAWRNRTLNARQLSAPVRLEAGKKYYIETLHKKDSGRDHLAVGWLVPGMGYSLILEDFLKPWRPDPADLDDDGLPDEWELAHGLDSRNPSGADGAHGDSDGDLLGNFEEWRHGTDPQKADTGGLPGLVQWEVWDSVTGNTIDRLTSNPRFPAQPDHRALLSSAEAPADRGSWYGGRLRGYLVPPVSGQYRLMVSGDDQATLYVSGGEGKFGRRLVAGAPFWTPERDYTRHAEQQATLTLEKGRRYYFEVLHKEESGHDSASVAWVVPGTQSPVIPSGSSIAAFTADPGDLDDDELPDAWEASYGLDARDNGNANPANGPWGDPDGDGLSNLTEWGLGTSPAGADSDGDGLSDDFEYLVTGTNPAAADSLTVAPAARVQGSAAAVVRGQAQVSGESIGSLSATGAVSFPFMLEEDGAAFFRLTAGIHPMASKTPMTLQVKVDGVELGAVPLTQTALPPGSASGRLPRLLKGPHTLEAAWTVPERGKAIRFDTLEIYKTEEDSGAAEEDAILQPAVTGSLTSPFCLEGTAAFPRLVRVDTGAEVRLLPNRGWYANVALPEDGSPLEVNASFENGLALRRTTVSWKACNILASGSLLVRTGDALRLTAFPEGAENSSAPVVILINGADTITTTADAPVGHVFSEPGTHTLSARFMPGGGQAETTGGITVKVLSAEVPDPVLLYTGRTRTFSLAGLPAEAEAWPDTSLHFLEQEGSSPRTFTAARSSQGDALVAFRLPQRGPVLGSTTLSALSLFSDADTHYHMEEPLPDGTRLIEMDVFLPAVKSGLRLRVDIIVAGVTFEDGTVTRWLTAEDFDASGMLRLRFAVAPGVSTSFCHQITLYDGDTVLGTR